MKPGEIKIKNTEVEINQGHFETVSMLKYWRPSNSSWFTFPFL